MTLRSDPGMSMTADKMGRSADCDSKTTEKCGITTRELLARVARGASKREGMGRAKANRPDMTVAFRPAYDAVRRIGDA